MPAARAAAIGLQDHVIPLAHNKFTGIQSFRDSFQIMPHARVHGQSKAVKIIQFAIRGWTAVPVHRTPMPDSIRRGRFAVDDKTRLRLRLHERQDFTRDFIVRNGS